MIFAGIEDEAERANLIAYLRIQSDSPAPLP
jgi:cytochrome c2